jgi:hypothetical protein
VTGSVPGPGFRRLSTAHPASDVRAWALHRGIEVSRTGGLPRFVYELYEAELTARASSAPDDRYQSRCAGSLDM